jgi:membrane fusion protein (multidrug efflux system)
MKKLLYIPVILLLAACSSKPIDKKTELADLQKQQQAINAKIIKLQAEVGTTEVAKITDVGTIEVKAGSFTNYIQIQGKIDAQDNVIAYPQSPGTITAIYVKPGQHVSKGQVLVQLDNSVMQQNYSPNRSTG